VPLLAPVAEKMGIDLVWFGVIIAINLQTSFLTPPFGFALFFLRSVAPKNAYKDRVTGRMMEPVTTGQIYWGAVPFVVIQVVMIGLTISFPSMVMHYKGAVVDPSTIEIKVPSLTPLAPGAGTTPTLGAPTLGAPTLGAPTLGAPTLGAPALGTPNLGAPALGTPDLGAPETPAPGEGGAAAPALPKLGAPVVNP